MNTLQMQLQASEKWGFQHFHRLFVAREGYTPRTLCALLGWKIFTITTDGTMHSSTKILMKAMAIYKDRN